MVSNQASQPIRIGQGFDVHAFADNRKLILGGVEISSPQGLAGHSDADVLTHAVIDALAGALALGDIGQWFPDSDPAFKDANSIELLKTVLADERIREWQIVNLDTTVIAQEPKLLPHIPGMRNNFARVFETDVKNISVKATSTEKLGFPGRGEGIAAMATLLITIRPPG